MKNNKLQLLKKKNFIFSFFFLLFSFFAWANSANATIFFKEGNNYYQEGKYFLAIQAYEKIENLGLQSAEVYYNLGNCFVKTNQVAQAIYNYEKALLLKPDDKLILHNLKLAYEKTKSGVKESYFKKPFNFFTFNKILVYLLIVLSCGALIIAIVYHGCKKTIFKNLAIIFCFLSLVVIILSFISTNANPVHSGIVFKDKAICYTINKKEKITTLDKGSKVWIINQQNDYFVIQMASQSQALLKKEGIKIID